MAVPSLLEEIVEIATQDQLQWLAKLDFVAFGGGLLKLRVGEYLASKGIRLLNHFGATETGPLAPIFVPSTEYDWRYFRLRSDLDIALNLDSSVDGSNTYRLKMRPYDWDRDYELADQLLARPTSSHRDFQVLARLDDVIALANGEKVSPAIFERELTELQNVRAAVAFGSGHTELGLLIVPSSPIPSFEEQALFKRTVWSKILDLNELADANARISSIKAVVVLPHDVALPRSDKGSIARNRVYSEFKSEIANVYEDLERDANEDITVMQEQDVRESLKKLVKSYLTWRLPRGGLGEDDDFFEMGMDSLQALRLRRLIISNLAPQPAGSPQQVIPKDIVYRYPTINKLARALQTTEQGSSMVNAAQTIDEYVAKYSINPNLTSEAVVLLTGATGSLGSFLLAHLATLVNVRSIICLNRSNSSVDLKLSPQERQRQALHSRGLSISDVAWSKVLALETETSLPFLGLEDGFYRQLSNEVTHVLHNAWPMDFQRGLWSFDKPFQSLQNLLWLVHGASLTRPSLKPKLLFLSSIAVVGRYAEQGSSTGAPELPVHDVQICNAIGYAQAKLVCERIIENMRSASESGPEIGYARLGQIGGSRQNGYWNPKEHIAILVKCSAAMKAFPKIPGVCGSSILLESTHYL